MRRSNNNRGWRLHPHTGHLRGKEIYQWPHRWAGAYSRGGGVTGVFTCYSGIYIDIYVPMKFHEKIFITEKVFKKIQKMRVFFTHPLIPIFRFLWVFSAFKIISGSLNNGRLYNQACKSMYWILFFDVRWIKIKEFY